MNHAFVARALHGLSVLHELEAHYPQRPDVLRFVVESRSGIYSVARISEELDGGADPIAGEHVPLDERLRAFYEDPLGVRSWAITAGSFFGPGVFVAARARRFLYDARVAAVYGLLGGAMAMLDGALFLSDKRRDEVSERLGKLAEAAAKVLRPDAAPSEACEVTETETEGPSADAHVGDAAGGVGDNDDKQPQPMPETLPAPAPDAVEEGKSPEPEPMTTGVESASTLAMTSDDLPPAVAVAAEQDAAVVVEEPQNAVEIASAGVGKSRRKKIG